MPRCPIIVALALVMGGAVGLAMGRWENRVARRAAGYLSEAKHIEAMSEEWDQINRYWDSKPEVAEALLERELRDYERLLQMTRQFKIPRAILTEDVLLREIGLVHMRLAGLCQRMNHPDCVSRHVNEVMQLRHISSNEVWAAITKLEKTAKAPSNPE